MLSSKQVLFTLDWITRHGFQAVPLDFESKKIFVKDDVFSQSYKHDSTLWEKNKLNIGVVTGPKNNGPFDIDLDSLEAVKLASFFLPHTYAVFGHDKKPRSHYLYHCEKSETLAYSKLNFKSDIFSRITFDDPSPSEYLNNQKRTLLEVRADNCQTMMPGSIHPDHQIPVSWLHPNPTIAIVNIESLIEQAKLLAAASLIARHVWLDGQRHETALQLSGIFYKLGKSLDFSENFIRALVHYSGSDDPAHLATVRTTYKRAQQDKSFKAIGEFTKRFKDHNPAMAKMVLNLLGANNDIIDELNEQFACVFIGVKHRIARLPTQLNEEILLIQNEDFKSHLANKFVSYRVDPTDPDSKVKTVNAAEYWLKSSRRNEYKSLSFQPSITQENMPFGVLNKFTGWALQPLNDPSKCQAFRTILEQYITDPAKPQEAQWLYTYFAHILRDPMDKQRAAVVIIGPQNIGKSIFVNYYGKILGRYHLNIADANRIYGRFNGHLECCLLLHSEEAIYANEKKHRSIIKDLISNKLLSYEEKYLGTWTAPSYTRLIYTSNEDNAAPVEIMDTRHSIFNMKSAKRVPSKELVAEMYKEFLGDGPASLMHFLLNYEHYNPLLLQQTIENKEKVSAITQSLDHNHDYWLEKLTTGVLLPPSLRWAQDNPKLNYNEQKIINWPYQVSRLALYADYKQYIDNIRRQPLSSMKFIKQFERWLPEWHMVQKLKGYNNPFFGDLGVSMHIRDMYSGKHQTLLNFPTLQECRTQFEAYTGQAFDWPEIQNSEEIEFESSPPSDTSLTY